MIKIKPDPKRPPVTVKRRETVTGKTVTQAKGGRGKRVHGSDADRQRAYRKRKAVS